jgi:hydrogenase maturation factor
MEIKHIACGEYVLLKNDYVVERGTYEECNATLNDYVEIYEWIDEMSNSRNQ